MQGKAKKIAVLVRRLVLPVLFAFMFTLLGLFSGLGYHLNYIDELSFVKHNQLGYADAVFACDIIYDPIVFPLYWVIGKGHMNGTYQMMYVPESYAPGEFGGPIWGLKKEDRYDAYVLYMLTWGTVLNLLFLLGVTITVEIVGQRSLYLVLLFGMFGFSVFQILGVFLGIVVGSLIVLLLFKWRPDNLIVRFWRSFWE